MLKGDVFVKCKHRKCFKSSLIHAYHELWYKRVQAMNSLSCLTRLRRSYLRNIDFGVRARWLGPGGALTITYRYFRVGFGLEKCIEIKFTGLTFY